jgi:hypothetical protein
MVAKYSYIKFHENSSSETKLFHADGNTDGQTDLNELRVAFRNCTNAPRKERYGRRVQCNLSVKKSIYLQGTHEIWLPNSQNRFTLFLRKLRNRWEVHKSERQAKWASPATDTINLARDAGLICSSVAGSYLFAALESRLIQCGTPMHNLADIHGQDFINVLEIRLPKLLLNASWAYNRRMPNGAQHSKMDHMILFCCCGTERHSFRHAIAIHHGRSDVHNWRFCFAASRYVNMRSPRRSVNIYGDRNTYSPLHTRGEKWSAIWKLTGVGRELEGENVHCVWKKRMLFTHIWIVQKYRSGEYRADYKWRGNASGNSVM